MNRLTRFTALSLALVGCAAAGNGLAHRQAAPAPAGLLKLQPVRGIKLPVESAPVRWRGDAYHLLGVNAPAFSLDQRDGHLTATAPAYVNTFDDVTYDVHVAVFDRAGRLLGTARTPVKVERMWLGYVARVSLDLRFDFGASQDYAGAATYAVAISRTRVLTPDEWQK